MNLKQLEVFIAVAESGSFSRAADVSFLTQSTVSQHISALEKEFDLKLLDRTGKGALLTEAGKLFLKHARRVTAESREVSQAMNRFRGLEEVTVRIGGSNIPACYVLPPCIPTFRERFPGVFVTVLQGDSKETLERLKRDEVELALVGTRFEEKEVVYTPLVHDRISLMVPAAHRWSGKPSISIDDLVHEPLIFRESGSGTARALTDELIKAGYALEHFRTNMCLGSNEAIKQAILSGAGVSFLSEVSVKKECVRGEMVQVKVQGLEIIRYFYLATCAGRDLAPAARAFIDNLLERFS
ncbi:MAG: selenium metabolism-associated LysR family transcriptional regulator [Syntrophotaleaceae bacterium]